MSLKPEEYRAWSVEHCRRFALTGDPVLAAFASWRTTSLRDYTLPELEAATNALAGQKLYGAGDHLQALVNAVKAARHAAALAEVGTVALEKYAFPELGTCDLCGSTGYVPVPAVRFRADGSPVVFPRHTQVVACRCARGRKLPGMTLERYEQLNPDWRDQTADAEAHRRQVLADQAAANGAARPCVYDEVLARLRRRLKE